MNPLEAYYSVVDGPDIDVALANFEPDATFNMNLAGRKLHGSSRAFLRSVLEGRGKTRMRHDVLRSAHADGVEFIYGALVEVENDRVDGYFLAAAHTNDARRITAYQLVFDRDATSLFP